MIAVMAPIGLADRAPAQPVSVDTPLDVLHEFVAESEAGFDMLFSMLHDGAESGDRVQRSVEVIRGIDGNDITLYIHRPASGADRLPAVLHLHGGGMVMLEAAGAAYQSWRDRLAETGMVVVGVEFRNGSGKLGPHPFPAGLNDCTSALRWLHTNREALGVSHIVVSGESGGGNLTLATTLQAKRNGDLEMIAGVYAQCPYISNAYSVPPPHLTSLFENDGYFLSCEQMSVLAHLYDPSGEHGGNPLAWPLFATAEDMAGLPPHVISVNELDPLRDEGLTYARALARSGVPVASRTVNGTCHGGDLIFVAAMPEVAAATIRDIAGFVASVASPR
jgi:acetyl esterase/lipase